MGRLIKTIGRVWPATSMSALSERAYNMMNLHWTSRTGIAIRLRSNSDLVAFHDIFRLGEYDEPIRHAMDLVGDGVVHALDLGADSGYFTLRLLDQMRTTHSHLTLAAVAVEGSPRNFARLESNLGHMSWPPASCVTLVHGLVGKRQGTGFMRERVFNAMNRVDEWGRPVPYVDVSDLVLAWRRIDLVKCDIEGSEGEFLKTYPDVMRKANAAVLELHEVGRPIISECRTLLSDYGLTNSKRLRAFADNTVEFFWR
jgi:FkbM family methyltransferase